MRKSNIIKKRTAPKKRYWYANISFMNSKKANVVVRAELVVEVSAKDYKFFPVTGAILWARQKWSEICIKETLQVNSVIEISREDYENFKAMRKEENNFASTIL